MADQVPHDDLVATATPAMRKATTVIEALMQDGGGEYDLATIVALGVCFRSMCIDADLDASAMLDQIADAAETGAFDGELDNTARQRAALLSFLRSL